MSDEKHRFIKMNGFKWLVCVRCDLVLLKNEATEKAVKRACVGQYIHVTMPENLKTKLDYK